MSARNDRDQSNTLMASGVGVAAIGVAGAALGAVCPICVVAAPALVGAGVYKRWRAGRTEAREKRAALDADVTP